MVTRITAGHSTSRSIWPHPEHSGLEDIYLWRAGRGLILQRLDCVRSECPAEPFQSVGFPDTEHGYIITIKRASGEN